MMQNPLFQSRPSWRIAAVPLLIVSSVCSQPSWAQSVPPAAAQDSGVRLSRVSATHGLYQSRQDKQVKYTPCRFDASGACLPLYDYREIKGPDGNYVQTMTRLDMNRGELEVYLGARPNVAPEPGKPKLEIAPSGFKELASTLGFNPNRNGDEYADFKKFLLEDQVKVDSALENRFLGYDTRNRTFSSQLESDQGRKSEAVDKLRELQISSLNLKNDPASLKKNLEFLKTSIRQEAQVAGCYVNGAAWGSTLQPKATTSMDPIQKEAWIKRCQKFQERYELVERRIREAMNGEAQVSYSRCGYVQGYSDQQVKKMIRHDLMTCDAQQGALSVCSGVSRCLADFGPQKGKVWTKFQVACKGLSSGECPSAVDCAKDTSLKLGSATPSAAKVIVPDDREGGSAGGAQ